MDQHDPSILFRPTAIATLCNNRAIDELRLFCKSLQIWMEQPPPIYCYCSSDVQTQIQKDNLGYGAKIHTNVGLDKYATLSREEMERQPSPSGLSNLFHDFTQEKCTLMQWALSEEKSQQGVLFCDVDLIWFGPLPLLPVGPTLGLSPHMIRTVDEAKYGEYNAGFVWTNDPKMPAAWRAACRSSRFFEQAALEDLADALPDEQIYKFPIQCNYGWWRMFQSEQTPQQQQKQWSFEQQSDGQTTGITIQGQPFVCIHTHLHTNDATTQLFNIFVKKQLEICKNRNPNAFLLYQILL